MKKVKIIVCMCFLSTLSVINARGVTYYVATTGDDGNSGTEASPWRTISKANNTLNAGDTVYVRAGTYAERINPNNNGSSGNFITYRAYPGETVWLEDTGSLDQMIRLAGRQYIEVDGFHIDARGTASFAASWNAGQHVTIKNCELTNGYISGHAVNIESLPYFRFENNTVSVAVDPGSSKMTDAIRLTEGSDYALFVGNTIYGAQHAGLKLEASYCVVRSNTFINNYNQAAESGGLYNGYGPFHDIVWEYNTFTAPVMGIDSDPQEGIQFYTKRTIVRFNVFKEIIGAGISTESYDDGGSNASDVQQNRIYHNVFYDCHESGVKFAVYTDGYTFEDMILKNNIFYKNYHDDQSSPYQIWMEDLAWERVPTSMKFVNNSFWYTSAGQDVIGHDWQGGQTISYWESNYPANFYGNMETNPAMMNPANGDFHLQDASPVIDQGDFLTRTTSAGSGTTVPVADTCYFSPGYGLVDGDKVVVGVNFAATIVSVDDAGHTITLDTSISWNANDGVSFAYCGNAPDIGAYEMIPEPAFMSLFVLILVTTIPRMKSEKNI